FVIPLFAGLTIALHFETLAFDVSLEPLEFRVMVDCRGRSHGTWCGFDGERFRLVPIPIQFRSSEIIALTILCLNILLGELSRWATRKKALFPSWKQTVQGHFRDSLRA